MPSNATSERLPDPLRRARFALAFRLPAPRLGVLMALAIALVAALAYWDAQRESANALSDFAREQATLAQGIAAAVSSQARLAPDAPLPDAVDLLAHVRTVERPWSLRLLLARPGDDGLTTSDGHVVRDPNIERGLPNGTPFIQLDRNEAPAFGLPRRTAVAGLSTFDASGGRWGVVVAATALRQRDREARAQWRSVMAVMLASGLVFVFGGVAMRKQRKELGLARELSIAELRREREEQLVQIDKLATMAALATGMLFQTSTTTNCSDFVAAGGFSLIASIVNAFIGNTVNHALGINSTTSVST